MLLPSDVGSRFKDAPDDMDAKYQIPVSSIRFNWTTQTYTPLTPKLNWGRVGLVTVNLQDTISWQLVALPPTPSLSTPGVGACVVDSIDCVILDADDPPALTITGSSAGSSTATIFFNGSSGGSMFTSQLSNVDGTPINLTGTSTAVPWTATTGQAQKINFSIIGPITFGGSSAGSFSMVIPGSSPYLVGVCLYVSHWNNVAQQWEVQSILEPSAGGFDHIIDYSVDMFYSPVVVSNYTGRTWRLSLRKPIKLSSGQALHVSFSNSGLSPAPMNVIPFIRTRLSVIS